MWKKGIGMGRGYRAKQNANTNDIWGVALQILSVRARKRGEDCWLLKS